MKPTLALLAAVATLAVPAFAGDPVTNTQAPAANFSPYRAGEFQIDAFGVYGFTKSGNERLLGDDAFGGGLGFNYFFTRWLGIGAEGTLFDTEGDVLGTTAVNLILRAPVGDSGLAFYAFGGAGITFNAEDLDSDDFDDARDRAEDDKDAKDTDDVLFLGHAGAGVEYRFSPNVGLFTDARYTWLETDNSDFGLIRAGVRIAF